MLHLCFIDRVAFALQSKYKDQFIADVKEVSNERVPVLIQRSQTAWDTHPQNYREIEHLATRVGEILFDESLDFTWCHLAIQARQLKAILPHIKSRDLGILAEIVLMLKDNIKTKAQKACLRDTCLADSSRINQANLKHEYPLTHSAP
jgi:hypothetical protein